MISFSGDGGLAMLLGELLTVRTHALPAKIVVFDNSSLGMVRLEMLVGGIPPFEAEARGFAWALGEIVLSGGVGDILRLAETNVRNIPRP